MDGCNFLTSWLYEAQLSFVGAFTDTDSWSSMMAPRLLPAPSPLPQFMSSVYFIGHVVVFLWLLLYFVGLGRVARRLGHNDTKQKT